jgi:hypothetical protein
MVSEGEEVLITISTISAVSGDPLTETSGGWKGLIDMEALKQNIYADRLIATRPKVRL